MPVVKIESAEGFDDFIGKDTLTMVDFYADWCPPCRMFAPILEEMAKELAAKVTVGKVNVDELQEVTEKQRIECMPTFIFYKNGKALDKAEGADQAAVRKMIQKHSQ